MSNRLPVLDILEEYFPEYQNFLMTYDKAWYEIAKQRTSDTEWEYVEFYTSEPNEHEIPIHVQDKPYLEKAREYFTANDYKACVIYLRTAFEAAIKKFCERKNLKVKYRENPKDLTSDDFWGPIKKGKPNDGTPFLGQELIDEIELYRSIILNPLSHAHIVPVVKKEVAEAMKAVEKLETMVNDRIIDTFE